MSRALNASIQRRKSSTLSSDIAGLRSTVTRLRKPSRRGGLGVEAEVGERALAVPVENEPCHLAVADVDHVRTSPRHVCEVESARPAASAPAQEREHALVVELAVLVHLSVNVLPHPEALAPRPCHRG